MPGVVKVVVKKNFVGVVAEKPWQAIQAANKLKVNWSAGDELAEPRGLLQLLAGGEADAGYAAGEFQRRGRKAGAGSGGAEGDLQLSVPNARVDGELVRRGGRSGRQGHALLADARRLARAKQRGSAAGPQAGKCACDLPQGFGLLWPERRRHGDLRRGAAFAGGGQTGARAADAKRGDGLGRELRIRIRDG